MNLNFERYIEKYLKSLRSCQISDAMAYSIEGGKRFRQLVTFSILKGMGIEEEIGYDCALALEFIQTYSLIHDDLPAIDNDDMRRGKLSLHKKYREDIAILTGDEFLTDAFGVIASSKNYDSITKVKMISCLSQYAGLQGMIYGQLLDVTSSSEIINEKALYEIQENKTCGLFKIACLFAMYIKGEDNESYYLELGSRIGHIFQNQDDLFDIIKSEEEMGKSLSDVKNDKGSALSLYTLDELQKIIAEEFNSLYQFLENASFNTDELKELIEKIRKR